MTAECRPPPGTPDQAVFVLMHEQAPRGMLHMWHADGWWRRCGERVRLKPDAMATLGWSIATPPEGEG